MLPIYFCLPKAPFWHSDALKRCQRFPLLYGDNWAVVLKEKVPQMGPSDQVSIFSLLADYAIL